MKQRMESMHCFIFFPLLNPDIIQTCIFFSSVTSTWSLDHSCCTACRSRSIDKFSIKTLVHSTPWPCDVSLPVYQRRVAIDRGVPSQKPGLIWVVLSMLISQHFYLFNKEYFRSIYCGRTGKVIEHLTPSLNMSSLKTWNNPPTWATCILTVRYLQRERCN